MELLLPESQTTPAKILRFYVRFQSVERENAAAPDARDVDDELAPQAAETVLENTDGLRRALEIVFEHQARFRTVEILWFHGSAPAGPRPGFESAASARAAA